MSHVTHVTHTQRSYHSECHARTPRPRPPPATPHLPSRTRTRYVARGRRNSLQQYCNTLQHTATHCNTLQHTATHCNTLQHTEPLLANSPNACVMLVVAMCCSVLQCCWFAEGSHCMLYNTAAHWSTLQQHTAKYCNTLQHTAITLQHTCNTLQHAATRCNTLQHPALQHPATHVVHV